MNVLSLFDGMSCGQIALNRLGISYDNYLASELDKYAIRVTQNNFPNTVQLGDVTKVNVRADGIYVGDDYLTEDKISEVIPNLLIGGSPCQGFSFAGKQLNFEDPRSKLFFEYVRILNEIRKYNPDVLFLLENVKMKKEYQDIISEYLGVQPISINSKVLSAQSRGRLYWSNIPINVDIPNTKNLVIKDILDYSISDEMDIQEKAIPNYLDEKGNPKGLRNLNDKANCLTASMRKGYGNDGITVIDKYQIIEYFESPKMSDSGLIQVGVANIQGHDILKRVYSIEGKSPTLNTMGGGNREPKIAVNKNRWRKLSPLECERLQTVPDNYTACVSNSQRYKMLGNGWTVDVICHLLKNIDLIC